MAQRPQRRGQFGFPSMTLRDPPKAAPKPRTRRKPAKSTKASLEDGGDAVTSAEQGALIGAVSGRARDRMNNKPETLTRLAYLGETQCTSDEIARAFGVTPAAFDTWMDTSDRCRGALEHGRSRGRAALRSAQLRLAQTNASMAIFLGRLYLGQSERREGDTVDPAEAAQTAERVREKLAALFAQASQSGSDRDDQKA
jgi:hypothetical protein